MLNVAAVAPTESSFFTLFPADAPKPLSANLNFIGGQPPVSNAVTVKLSATGTISIYNLAGNVHFTADVVGYFVGHHHDDRYYTEAETNAALATKVNATDVYAKSDVYTKTEVDAATAAALERTPTAWGMARGDGSLRVNSPNVVRVDHPVSVSTASCSTLRSRTPDSKRRRSRVRDRAR